ncbi:MAG: GAF domain-containing protein, partial [Nocardioidaceae bacterium]
MAPHPTGTVSADPTTDPAKQATTASERRVWRLIWLMAALAGLLVGPMFAQAPHAAVPTVAWGVLLPLFALAEVVVIHLPAQRSSHSHTLREIPAIAGLTFLAPQQYVTAYVLGAGLALLLWSRQRGVKLAFNVSMFAVEAGVGATVYHLVLAGGDPIAPRAWGAAALAVLLTDLASAAAVTAAISLTDGRFDDQVLRESLRSGIPAAMVNTCVALLGVTMAVARPSVLPLLGLVVVLLVVGYRFYVSLARGYAQMDLLYQFVGSTGRSAELDEVIPTVLSEAARLLRSVRAELVSLSVDGTPAESWTWKDGVLTGGGGRVTSWQWWEAATRGEPVRKGLAGPRGGDGTGPRDGLAVPVREGGEVRGVLIVTDRSFEEETYSAGDLPVFEALAAHAGVALEKARVVDSLRRLAAQREHDALHDPLTGLPNRRAFV